MSFSFKNHVCKGDNCMYCLSHVQQAYQVALLFRSSDQNFRNNSNNSQCSYETPTNVPQRVTVEATPIIINSVSLEAISHCQTIQSDLQPIEQQAIPSPTILVETSSDSEDESESILMEPTVEENESEISKTEYFEQSIRDQALFCDPSKEKTLKETDETVDNQSCLLDVASQFSPSTSGTEVFLSASDGQESTSNTYTTCENQSSLQNATAPLNDPLCLDNMSIPGAKKSKRGRRPKCKYPNCRGKDANKIRASNGKPLHICHIPNCGKVYSVIAHLKRHLDTHSGEKNFFCAHCNTGFTRKDNLENHVKKCQYLSCSSVNCNVKGIKKTTCLNSKAYLCPILDCGKRFKYPSEFRSHLDQHYGKKNFFCELCNKGFTLKPCLKQHLKRHVNPKHNQSHKKVCDCPCLNCRAQGGNHACGNWQHVCHIPDCGRVCSNIWIFKRHLDLHSGKKNFFCSHCNKGYARKDNLQSHILVHMQRKAKHTKC